MGLPRKKIEKILLKHFKMEKISIFIKLKAGGVGQHTQADYVIILDP